MSNAAVISKAGAVLAEVTGNIKPDQLAEPTPCAEYDVRGLINHLLFWGPSLAGAAGKQPTPPPAESEQDIDLAEGDWAAALSANTDRLVAAWSEPRAWDGSTTMTGAMELPASMVGGMVLCELVVHAWDLARATGQSPQWPDDVQAAAHETLTSMAEQGRQMGAFGPAVAVPAGASLLDRALGASGRDPHWPG